MNDSAESRQHHSLVTYEGIHDPTLSQEERDLRLALALQQQENAAALATHAQRQATQKATHDLRTARSGAKEGLSHLRKKTAAAAARPSASEYVAPAYYGVGSNPSTHTHASSAIMDEDFRLAMEMQMAEDNAAGTARLVEKLIKEEVKDKEDKELRSGRSMARH